MSYINDKGHLTDEALSLYAEALKFDQLEQLPEELRGHLESCPACQEQAMALYALIADEDYSGLGPHPAFGRAGRMPSASTLKMWFRPLLLLLMALLALFLFLQQQRSRERSPAVEEDTPATTPSVDQEVRDAVAPLNPPQAKAESERATQGPPEHRKSETNIQNSKIEPPLLAANFTPYEPLESLVGTVTRSQGLSDIQPPVGAELKIGQAVVFSWQTSDGQPLTVRLLNNREEEIFSRAVEGGRLDSPVQLNPGLYYWKLETADDLLFVGKFLVGSLE